MPKPRSSSRRRSYTDRNSKKVHRNTQHLKSRSRSRSGSRSTSTQKNNELHWRTIAPMSMSSRLNMTPNCFLDEKNRKYPICPKRVNKTTCKGLAASRARAVMNGDEYIVAKADKHMQVLMCDENHARKRDVRIIDKSLRRSSRSNTERRLRRHSLDVKRKASRSKKSTAPMLHHLTNIGRQIRYEKSKINVVDV